MGVQAIPLSGVITRTGNIFGVDTDVSVKCCDLPPPVNRQVTALCCECADKKLEIC